MKLIIEDDEGRKTVVPFVREEITIGRQEKGNTIRLTERNVSRRHARLVKAGAQVLVEDLGSFNGTRVNGEKIQGKKPIREGDLIEIGDYDLAIQGVAEDAASTAGAAPPAPADAPPVLAASPSPTADSITKPIPRQPPPPPNGHAVPANGTAKREATAVIRVAETAAAAASRPVQEIPPEDAPRLVCISTESAGREFVVDKTVLRLGRTEQDNDVAVDHRSISRNHAKLVRGEDGSWSVIDLQSANGVKVNGEQYGVAPMRYGDVLELGHVRFKLVAPGEQFAFTPEPPTDPQPRKKGGSKTPLIAGAVAAVVAIAGGVGFFATRGGAEPQKPPEPKPVVATRTEPVKPPEPAPAPPPRAAEPAPEPAAAAAQPSDEIDMGSTDSAKPADEARTDAAAAKRAERDLKDKDYRSALQEADKVVGRKGDELRKRIVEARQREIDGIAAVAEREIQLGKLQAAVARAGTIDELAPNDPAARHIRDSVAKAREAKKTELPVAEAAPRPKKEKKVVAAAEETSAPAEKAEAPRPAPRADGASAKAAYMAGFKAQQAGDYAGCVHEMENAIHADGAYADAFRGIANCHNKLGQTKQGYCYFKRYLGLRPGAPDATPIRNWMQQMDDAGEGVQNCKAVVGH